MGRQHPPSVESAEDRDRSGLEKLRRLVSQLPDDAVIVCIGSTLLGDDGAGPVLARALKESSLRWPVFDAGIAPENYLMPVARLRPAWVVLADALDFGGRPGDVDVLDVADLDGTTPGTHGPDPVSFASLLMKMTRCRITVVGIQPGGLAPGSPLSRPVALAIEVVAAVFATR